MIVQIITCYNQSSRSQSPVEQDIFDSFIRLLTALFRSRKTDVSAILTPYFNTDTLIDSVCGAGCLQLHQDSVEHVNV